ncbi:hypothetical protein FNH22_27210 [Fulvivirga sp. M361]|uniref:hypothetical protein n=1 Tax=Fulvivirga sp. M361 TaxID=2594266 RepID=UPI00117A97F2|nr:hypothetical protein [Fulvivirga sp. M361]TRX49318.1 hypothetical protein FNH22_27210 [Fulvivirga sp. M361]
MKEDKLNYRIEQERPSFDIYEVDAAELWTGIDQGIKSRRTLFNIKTISRIAAALVVGVGLSWILLNYDAQSYKNGFSLSDISPELAETEFFYSQQVAEKIQLIKASNRVIDPEVMDNLAALDSAYQDLKIDLKDNADNEEVVNAMITNYRIKLQILEQILLEIKDHDKEGSDEISI